MGLDMYLRAERYLWHNEAEVRDAVRKAIGLEQNLEVKSVQVEAAYWRKANHIHAWFVENVQDGEDNCASYYVSREKLVELHALCREVLEAYNSMPIGKWREFASEHLCTQEGFFFGSTEYDDGYIEDIKSTIDQLEVALTLPKEWSFEYHSSW